jgi:hypothetical protein
MANLRTQYELIFVSSMRKKVNICQARRYELHLTGLEFFKTGGIREKKLTELYVSRAFLYQWNNTTPC